MLLSEIELRRLHSECAAPVYRYLWTLTQDAGAAEDLLQEVFGKLAADAGILAGAESERAVLFRIARNAAVDWSRRRKVRAEADRRWAAEVPGWFLPAAGADEEVIRARLTEALASLPDDQRTAVHCHLWEGLTFREMATLEGVPLQTVASRYRYGLARLRTALHSLYSEFQ